MIFPVSALNMRGIILSTGQVFKLKQFNFSYTMRALNICLLEPDIKVFNQPLLPSFSTSQSLLRVNRSLEDKPKAKTDEKKREKASQVTASQSGSEKKNEKKSKSLSMRPEINENDFLFKMKQIKKFLEKRIQVVIRVDNPKSTGLTAETLFSKIQKTVTEEQIQARIILKGHVIEVFPVNAAKTESKNDVTADSTAIKE